MLDLPGHQDIADSAAFYESLELSYSSINNGERMAFVGPKIRRAVPRLNQKDIEKSRNFTSFQNAYQDAHWNQ